MDGSWCWRSQLASFAAHFGHCYGYVVCFFFIYSCLPIVHPEHDNPGLDVLIDIISLGPVLTFETLLNAWMIVDHVQFDIPDNEYVQPR